MMRKTSCAVLAAVLALSLSVGVFAEGGSFSDVPETHWGYADIERSFSDGVVNGTYFDEITGTRTFEPGKTVTVAEFTTVMTRAFFPETLEEMASEVSPQDRWFAVYMLTGKKAGLFAGIEDAGEDPTRVMTRYEMAAMLWNIVTGMGEREGVTLPETEPAETVAPRIGDWSSIPEKYQTAVASAVSLGLLRGVDGKGSFAGENSLTRAEMAVIYSRLADLAAAILPGIDPAEPVTPQPGDPDPSDPIPVPAPIEPPTVDI